MAFAANVKDTNNKPSTIPADASDLQEQLRQMTADKEAAEAALAAEKAKKAPKARDIYLKVSEKGGASLYGIRRFPITFYIEEWLRILGMEPEIRAFLESHKGELTVKDAA